MQLVNGKVSKQRLIGHDWRQSSKPLKTGMSNFTELFFYSSPTASDNSQRPFHAVNVELTY